MSLPLLLPLCRECLVCLICMVFAMGGRWPYNYNFVGCCLQNLVREPLGTKFKF